MSRSLIRIWLNTDAAGAVEFCEHLASLDLLRQWGGGSTTVVQSGFDFLSLADRRAVEKFLLARWERQRAARRPARASR